MKNAAAPKSKRGPLKTVFLDIPHGLFSFSVIVVNTAFWVVPVLVGIAIKLAVPNARWRRFWGIAVDKIASCWAMFNLVFARHTMETKWIFPRIDGLKPDGCYLVIANHQSGVDILALQMLLTGKLPFLKFFIKKELLFVPVMGLAWWALDYPFMTRYSKEFLEKHPHLKGRDIEITRRACRRFGPVPVAIVNFLEGTRFTPQKYRRQKSPYRHLLKPKAGGIGYVLTSMGERVDAIIDVTIIYPEGIPSLVDFLCGRIGTVELLAEKIPVTKELLGDYSADEAYQERFRSWVNGVWERKGDLMQSRLCGR